MVTPHRIATVLLAASLVLPAVALAGKGGNGGGNGHGNALEASSSITLDQAGQALSLGDSVTFTTQVVGLRGSEWPMVYVECRSAATGALVYGQLDHPDATFVLGGGSSDWWLVRGAASCWAHLYSYGGKTSGGLDETRELAAPVSFDATG